jgi:hypothetical protein
MTMKAGSVMAGIIVGFLGFAGLMDIFGRPIVPINLASIGIVFTPSGALIIFGAMAAIGVALVVDGVVSGEAKVVVLEASTAQPIIVRSTGAPQPLPELDLAVLRYVSQGKRTNEISVATGVDNNLISEKIRRLRTEGYITEKDELTEKGFEALRRTETVVIEPSAGRIRY